MAADFHPDDVDALVRMAGHDALADKQLQERYLRRLRFFHAGAQRGGPLGPLGLAALLDDLGFKALVEIRDAAAPPRINWDEVAEGQRVVVAMPDKPTRTGIYVGRVGGGLLTIVFADNFSGELIPPRFVKLDDVLPAGVSPDGFDIETTMDDLIAVHDEIPGDDLLSEREDLGEWRRVAPGTEILVFRDNDLVAAEFIGPSRRDGRITVKLADSGKVIDVMIEAATQADPAIATTEGAAGDAAVDDL